MISDSERTKLLSPREGISKHVEERPDSTAVISVDRDEAYSYREFDDRTNRVARFLRDQGVSKGDRVGMALFNTPEFLEVMYACYRLGAVHVPLNPQLAAGEFQYLIDDMGAELMIYDAEVADTVHKAVTQLAGERVELIVDGPAPAAGVEEYDALFAATDAGLDSAVDLNPDDSRYFLYTSGTTGQPKGVVIDDETIRYRALEYPLNFGLDGDTVAVNLTPWFHGAGVEAVIHPVFLTGGTIVSVKHPDLDSVLPCIREHDISYVVNSITHTQRLVQRHQDGTLPDVNFDPIDIWFPMGQAIPRQLAVDAQEIITSNLYTVYGSTEMLLATVTRPRDLPEKAGLDGISSIQNRVRIIEHREDERVKPDEMVEPGELGEIICQSPVLPDRYFGKSNETEATFYNGWFYTDDLGAVDDEGFLSVKGRVSDMIISGGENIAASEVEAALLTVNGVRNAAVIGVPDAEWGERVTAFVVRDEDLTEETLDDMMIKSNELADFKRPRRYEFVGDLPTTDTGKIQRSELRNRVTED